MNQIILTEQRPEDFIFLKEFCADIIESVRYYDVENFVGRKLLGYEAPKILCTKQAALALEKAVQDLALQGYDIVVYDGFRPHRTVRYFTEWVSDPLDQIAKMKYYPTIDKADICSLGYIAPKASSHSRGGTFDLTIIKKGHFLQKVNPKKRQLVNGDSILFLDDGTVDMGSSFDLFHEASWHNSSVVTSENLANRAILRQAMEKAGFAPYAKEWWHYTLVNEIYTDRYFDFPITIF